MLRSTRQLLAPVLKTVVRKPHIAGPLSSWPANFAACRSIPAVRRCEFATSARKWQRNIELEEVAKKLEDRPENMTKKTPRVADDVQKDVLADVKKDLGHIAEAVSLGSVPREAYVLGLAGTLPYLGTSISTVYLSWVLYTANFNAPGYLTSITVSHDVAQQLLQHIEPIQVGYGAVIISFLGAIHWGLEFAEKSPLVDRTRFRYGIGLAASILAWPTVVMPIYWALITQFTTFAGLYFADSQATRRGWAPSWYSTYRFVLTAVVGVSLFLSLVGRETFGKNRARLSSKDITAKFLKQHHTSGQLSQEELNHMEEKEKTERKRLQKEAAEKKRQEEELKKKGEEEKTKGADKMDDKGNTQKGDK